MVSSSSPLRKAVVISSESHSMSSAATSVKMAWMTDSLMVGAKFSTKSHPGLTETLSNQASLVPLSLRADFLETGSHPLVLVRGFHGFGMSRLSEVAKTYSTASRVRVTPSSLIPAMLRRLLIRVDSNGVRRGRSWTLSQQECWMEQEMVKEVWQVYVAPVEHRLSRTP
jgi:hypothetical protein